MADTAVAKKPPTELCATTPNIAPAEAVANLTFEDEAKAVNRVAPVSGSRLGASGRPSAPWESLRPEPSARPGSKRIVRHGHQAVNQVIHAVHKSTKRQLSGAFTPIYEQAQSEKPLKRLDAAHWLQRRYSRLNTRCRRHSSRGAGKSLR